MRCINPIRSLHFYFRSAPLPSPFFPCKTFGTVSSHNFFPVGVRNVSETFAAAATAAAAGNRVNASLITATVFAFRFNFYVARSSRLLSPPESITRPLEGKGNANHHHHHQNSSNKTHFPIITQLHFLLRPILP